MMLFLPDVVNQQIINNSRVDEQKKKTGVG